MPDDKPKQEGVVTEALPDNKFRGKLQDDREIFKKSIKPNIVSIEGTNYSGSFKDAKELVELFENAKTFGSLIRVPEELILKLPIQLQRKSFLK